MDSLYMETTPTPIAGDPRYKTTGRYLDNRYYELDPVGFDPTALFKQITPGL
jgi:hypothetical protein